MTLNDAGQAAFTGGVVGPDIDNINGTGLWAEDANNNLVLVARGGNTITVGPGDDRTIARIEFIGEQNARNYERNSGFNSQGKLVFQALFSDGTEAILTYDLVVVPEPTSMLLATIGLLSIAAIRNRRSAFKLT